MLFPILLGSCISETRKASDDPFAGRWKLHLVETQKAPDAPWIKRTDHYKNRKGYLIYDGMGGMGVHHVTEDYELYQTETNSKRLDSMSKNDLRHLANNFVYFGKYRVNDSLNIIEHHIESANLPWMWGTIAKRAFQFNGDTLTLYPVRESFPKTRLHWISMNDRE